MSAPEPTQCHIDLIPVEILTEIFLHVCDAHTPSNQPKSLQEALSSYIRPIDLSHVCRHWRGVALACGRLWTFILVSDRHEHHLERLNAFAERSGQSPLHVFISWTPTKDFDPIDWMRFSQIRDVFMHKTLEAIILSGHRWASFFLIIETSDLMSRILRRLSMVETPLLKDIALYTMVYNGVDAWLNEEAIVANDAGWYRSSSVPVCDPRTLYLYRTELNWPNCTPCYSNLRSLTLDHVTGPSIPVFMHFLAAFPLLEALSLRTFRVNTLRSGTQNAPLVELPLLRYFSITGLRPQDGEVLFTQLRIPNVKVMALDCEEQHNAYDDLRWDTAVSLLSAAYPGSSASALDSVQVLRIGQLECDSSLLSSLFHRLSSLRVLVVDCSSAGWREFLVHVQTTPHLPLLTTLVCPAISYRQLHHLVVKRTPPEVPIQRVFIAKYTRFSSNAVVSTSRTVEVLDQLPSSEKGQIDASLGELVAAYLRVEE